MQTLNEVDRAARYAAMLPASGPAQAHSHTAHLAAVLAIASAAAAPMLGQGVAFKAPRRTKRHPQMVTSSDEAIALHNAAVSTRQVRRSSAPVFDRKE